MRLLRALVRCVPIAASLACGGSVSNPPNGAPPPDAHFGADVTESGASLDAFMTMPHDAGIELDTGAAADDRQANGEASDAGSVDATALGDSANSDGDVACRLLAGNACVSCCAGKNSSGRGELDLVGTSCMCSRCSSSCNTTTCQMHSLPQSPCIACVKQSLLNDCTANGYLDQFCAPGHECRAYVDCLLQCPD